MAIQAKFQADFSSFLDAIKKADVELGNMAKGASGVEAKLTRMTDSFSGRKIIQEAVLTATAIEAMGGASKLTASELEQAGAKAAEAAEKMKKLGYEVPPGIQRLADATAQIPKQMDSADRSTGIFAGTIGKLAAAFSISSLIDRAVGTLVGWTKEVITSAGALQDMSAKTGISTEQLQRFGFVGKQAGVSVEEFSSAAFKLGVRLDGGSKSIRTTVENMHGLGMSFEELRALSPEDQFNKIVGALEGMENQQEKNRTGVELFGKSFEQIAPAVAAGYTEMAKQARVSSDAQVQAIANASDAWDRFIANQKSSLTSWLGNWVIARDQVGKLSAEQMSHYQALLRSGGDAQGFLLEAARLAAKQIDIVLPKQRAQSDATASYAEQVKKALLEVETLTNADIAEIAAAQKLGKQTEEITNRFGLSEEALRLLNEQTRENTSANTKAESAAKKHAEEQKRIKERYDDTAKALERWNANAVLNATSSERMLVNLKGLVPELEKTNFEKNRDALEKWQQAAAKGADSASDLANNLRGLGVELPKTTIGLTFGQSLVAGLDKSLKSIPQTIAQAFTGGGGLTGALKSIGSSLGADLGTSIFGTLDKVTGVGVSGLVKGMSGKLAGLVSSLGPTIGALAGPIISLFGKLFDNPEKKINPIREAFVQLNGGLALLNKRAHDAGVTLDAMLNAKNPEQYQKAIEDLNAAFKFQDDAMELLTATAHKYGFTLAELGPALQKQNLGKQAEEIYQDFAVLTAGGLDHVAILTRMSEGVNTYIKNARSMGIEVPSSMEPMLQQMIDLGLLTDDNGDKITDLKGTGVTFSTTLTAGFKSVVEAVEKLAAAISGKLGTALANIPEDVNIGVHFDVDSPEMPRFDAIPMASGGMGRVTKPTLFFSKGNEDFAFSGEGKSFSDNSQTTGGDMTFNVTMNNVNDPKTFTEELRKLVRQNYRGIRTDLTESTA